MAQFTELLPPVLTLVGFWAGFLLSWHFTGKYYRRLVAELIERHRALTAQMRVEHEAAIGQLDQTSAA